MAPYTTSITTRRHTLNQAHFGVILTRGTQADVLELSSPQ
ncbi:MAG: hypothetical protein ACI9P7_000110 [Candidatus Azotimanducaceae bacterium]|jgi:hypothetical protein